MTDITAISPAPSAEPIAPPEPTACLQPATAAAERERVRLETTAGRSRPSALVAVLRMRLRHLGSEEAAKSGLRYQPVAWAAIAIIAIAGFFPGRDDGHPIDGDLAQAPASASPTTTPTTTPAAPSGPAAFRAPDFEFTFAPPIPPSTAFTPPTTLAPPVTSQPPGPGLVELTVRGFGWAGSLSGTGLGTATVPEGTMPVGSRLGELDKVTFMRLSGTATKLVLAEDTAGAREAVGEGLVRACAIVEAGWTEEPDQSLEDAPTIDTDRCVEGVEVGNTWTFDLSDFASRTGQAGFALLPATGAPADFQVTFEPG